MPYEYIASSATPRLLILLTDESEESVKLVNSLIDQAIQINFDGDAPKNRCFISVIGYNHNVKILCSGWLKDLESSLVLRFDHQIKKVSDGTGGIIEIERKQPVWVESTKLQNSSKQYNKAIQFAKELSIRWGEDHYLSPIVIDCSEDSHIAYAEDEIKQLKAITTKDGNVLFFGCYSKDENASEIFSKIPDEWGERFSQLELNETKFCKGLLSRKHIGIIFCAIMDIGAEESGCKTV